MSPVEILRALPTWLVGPALASAAEAQRIARVAGGGSVGTGAAWSRFEADGAGIRVTRRDGVRDLVTWADVQQIRDDAPPGAMDALDAALAHKSAGPRWRGHTLPVHLRPEGRHLSDLDDDAWRAAQRECGDAWAVRVTEYRAYHDAAAARLADAVAAVLVDPAPSDLLGFLAEMTTQEHAHVR